MLTDS
jgi:exportin-2 (importin alpha re-exporter)